MSGWWEGQAGPRLFNIPPGVAFLPALARGLLEMHAAMPASLARATVLLPTRRAVRQFTLCLTRASQRRGLVLPTIRALGDLEPDEEPFAPGAVAADIPPAIARTTRCHLLGHLVLRAMSTGDPDGFSLPPASAVAMGRELGNLIDEAAGFGGLDVAALYGLYDRLPEHLRRAGLFLEILQEHWPAILAERGEIDPGERTDQVLRALAAHWRETPPQDVTIVAGSTGSLPATAEVMRATALAPQGLCVLPGLDLQLDDAAWNALEEHHPQFGLKRLLSQLGTARGEVRPWPAGTVPTSLSRRQRYLNEALRPANLTADWLSRAISTGLKQDDTALDGIQLIEAEDTADEVRAIVATTRRALVEGTAKQVMIVTPDTGLVRWLSSSFEAQGIVVNLSLGRRLDTHPVGTFLGLLLQLMADPVDPVSIAGLLHHPLTRCGLSLAARDEAANWFDRHVLRGMRAASTAVMKARVEASGKSVPAGVDRFMELLEAIAHAQMPARQTVSLWVEHLCRIAEQAARSDQLDGASRLWAGEGGAAAGRLVGELYHANAPLGDMPVLRFVDLWEEAVRQVQVRERQQGNGAVEILGPLEARLQSADLVILAGLNEGTWPVVPAHDPFTSPAMRTRLSMPQIERKIGQAAHDFAQFACAPQVVLTRASQANGEPTIASRWVWRLVMFARALGLERRLVQPVHDGRFLWARSVHHGPANPVAPPAPRDLAGRRRASLRVTDLVYLLPVAGGEALTDAFFFYARDVLRLEALEAKDKTFDPRAWGTAVHDAIEQATLGFGDGDAPALEHDITRRLGDWLVGTGMSPALQQLQSRRIRLLARAYADFHVRRREAGRALMLERKGVWDTGLSLPVLDACLTVRGKADRIEIGAGEAVIWDAKTGQVDTGKKVEQLAAPQLIAYAEMLAEGAFEEVSAPQQIAVGFIELAGKSAETPHMPLLDAASVAAARDALRHALNVAALRYGDRDLMFTAPEKPSPYDDFGLLARRAEWLEYTVDGEADRGGGDDA